MVARLQRRLPLLWAAPLLLLDQLSKSWALGQLAGGETLPLLPPYVQLTLVENRGMVFGLLPDWGEALTVLALVVVGWLLLAYPRLAARPLERLGAVLVLSGALGNALDRLRYGFVVDFVHLEWPGLAGKCVEFRRSRAGAGGIVVGVEGGAAGLSSAAYR